MKTQSCTAERERGVNTDSCFGVILPLIEDTQHVCVIDSAHQQWLHIHPVIPLIVSMYISSL